MTLHKSNILISSKIIFFIACFGLFFPGSIKSQNHLQPKEQSPVPVILIGGLGATILSENPKLIPCSRNLIKNTNQFTKELIDDGYPKDALLGDPANLAFDESGHPLTNTLSGKLKPVGFLKLPEPVKDLCDLSIYLQNRKYQRDVNLFEFYYDFRYSVRHNAEELKTFIEKIKTRLHYPRFNIVAHSLGGLIAKQYLTNQANAETVEKLILVGTPNLGSPWALIALRYGLKGIIKVPFFDGCKIKKAFHNVPSLFNLLPAQKYFSPDRSYILDQNGRALTFEQTLSFLKNQDEVRCLEDKDSPAGKLSETLLKDEFLNFSEERDNWRKPPNVQVFALAGYGRSTLTTIKEEKNGQSLKLCRTTEGDTIVPLWSAESVEANARYYIDLKNLKTDHISMIGKKEIEQGILILLQKGTIDTEKVNGFSRTRPLNFKRDSECHEP